MFVLSVCLSVSPLVGSVYCAKMAEAAEMSVRSGASDGSKERCINGVLADIRSDES